MSKKIVTALIIFLTYPYIKTAIGLLRIDFKLKNVYVESLQGELLKFSVVLNATSSKNSQVHFERIEADIIMQGKKIGKISNSYDFYFSDNIRFAVPFGIDKAELSAQFWNAVHTNNTDIEIELKGKAVANGQSFPLSISFNSNELITGDEK